jgi:hypothetical protein
VAFANSKLMHATNQSDPYRMPIHPGPCVIPACLEGIVRMVSQLKEARIAPPIQGLILHAVRIAGAMDRQPFEIAQHIQTSRRCRIAHFTFDGNDIRFHRRSGAPLP